jgi:hypothetical protein
MRGGRFRIVSVQGVAIAEAKIALKNPDHFDQL